MSDDVSILHHTVGCWVVWSKEIRNGKATKVPRQPNGRPARVNDPTTWCDYHTAVRALETGRFAGLGIVLRDGLVGIDLDWKGYPGDGIPLEAQAILDRFASYAELSPSGKGAHILLLGRLPAGARNRTRLEGGVDLEVYGEGRFFTFTGRRINDHDITDQQAELEALLRDLDMLAPAPAPGRPARAPQPVALDDAELIARMFKSKSGADIERLWRGDWSAYPSQSEADMALASHLVWWCGGDLSRADRLFRQSGLYRKKWDERRYSDGRTYGQATLERARSSLNGGYEPHPRARGRPAATPTVEAPARPSDWPEPEPLEGAARLQPWPQGKVLPPDMEDYALAFADRLCLDPAPVCMSLLVAATAVTGGRLWVEPDVDNPTWREPTALWLATVMPVSSKKTPLLKAALAPVWAIEAELRAEHEAELAEYKAELQRWESAKRGERGPRPGRPKAKRLLAQDATREALGDLLANNPGILAYHDELSGLFKSWAREDRGADRAFYLSAYSAAPIHIDRISRGATFVERPVLSLMGYIQPGPFRERVLEAQSGDANGADGLLQRFVIVTAAERPWEDSRPPIPEEARERYHGLINRVYDTLHKGPERVLRLALEAQQLWYGWESQTERELRNPDHPEAWKALLGKRLGLTARLAAVLSALWGEYIAISETTLRRAIALTLWLEPHARRIWHRAISGNDEPVLKLARKLQAGELERFALRDLYRKGVAGIATAEQARWVVLRLAEAKWVARDPQNPQVWRVNPRCLEVRGD